MDVLVDELFEINFSDRISIICVPLKVTFIDKAPRSHLQQCLIDLLNFHILLLYFSLSVLSCSQLCLLHCLLASLLLVFQ